MPEFNTYQEAQSWIAERAAAYGGKRKLYASEEYRAAYPAIKKAFDAGMSSNGAAGIQHCRNNGFSHGDTVRVLVGSHLLFGPVFREARLDLSGSEPVAHLFETYRADNMKRGIRKIRFPKIATKG